MITVLHKQSDTYTMVARVDTDDLESAWELTNHISWNWLENPLVTAFVDSARSSMVGDIFYAHGRGAFYQVAPAGFDRLPLNMRLSITLGELRTILGSI